MRYRIRLNDKLYEVEVEQGEAVMLSVSDAIDASAASTAPIAPAVSEASTVQTGAPVSVGGGELIPSPLPGVIMDIMVSSGQNVEKGQVLVLIEAMKMENEVLAPRDGVVKQIMASKGESVETGSPLLTLS